MTKTFEIPSGPNNQCVQAQYQEPAEATTPDNQKMLVLMVHGFPGYHKQSHEDLFGDLEYLFTTSGLHCLRFDFRSCGASEGLQEDFTFTTANEDMDAVLNWAYKQGFEKIIYVAEGLGAAIAARKMNKTTKLAFFFWPLLDLQYHADNHFKAPHSFVDKMGQELIDDMNTFDLIPYLNTLTAPILMQYGDQDEFFDSHQLDYFRAHVKAPRVDITSYQDGRNGLIGTRHRQMIFYHIGQFLSKFGS